MGQRMTLWVTTVLLASVAVVAVAATPFDGMYRGTFYPSGAAGQCPPGGDLSVNVVDGVFNVRSSNSTEMVATKVNPDGSFSVQAGVRNVRGTIRGNELTATLTTGGRCTYVWSLKK